MDSEEDEVADLPMSNEKNTFKDLSRIPSSMKATNMKQTGTSMGKFQRQSTIDNNSKSKRAGTKMMMGGLGGFGTLKPSGGLPKRTGTKMMGGFGTKTFGLANKARVTNSRLKNDSSRVSSANQSLMSID